MANVKAVDVDKLNADLKTIGDSIRAKAGTSQQFTSAQGMANAITAIPGGGCNGLIAQIITGSPYVIRTDYAGPIAGRAFVDSNLAEFYGPNITGVGNNSFRQCTKTKVIEVPNIEYIAQDGFYGPSVERLDFNKLKSIGKWGLDSLLNLKALIIRTPTMCTLSGSDSIYNCSITKGTGFVYVPKTLVEQYKAATNWVTFAAQIRAIEDYPEITGGAV